MAATIRCRTTSRALSSTKATPGIPARMLRTVERPDCCWLGRSVWVTSPVMIIFELNPRRVRNIFICSGDVFWASSRTTQASLSVRPLM